MTLIALRILLPDDEPQFPARGKAFGAPFGASSHGSADQAADDSTEEQDNLEPRASPEPVKKLSWFEPRLRPWVITGLLGGHAHAMILGISGFFVMDRLGLREVPLEAAAPIGIVLMVGALATLSAQWGIIPILKLGPRAATLWGIAVAGFGVLMFGVAQSLYAICISYAIVSLGFGLFRPGFTAGSSLAVTRAEQGEASGAVASINGAAFVFAPALGVLLYNWSEWIGFAIIVAICLAVLLFGWRSLALDEETTRDHPA